MDNRPWLAAQRKFCVAALELMEDWKDEDYPKFDVSVVDAITRLWQVFKDHAAS